MPTLAQSTGPTPPGLYINWTINLAPVVAGGPSGTAKYIDVRDIVAGKGHMRFAVECEYVDYPSGTMLDVFIKGPSSSLNEPPTRVGRMEVQNNSASLLLLTAQAPKIKKGTQVMVKTDTGILLMAGHF